MREIIVNLKNTILTYAASKDHTHTGYASSADLTNHINTQANSNTSGHVRIDNSITSSTNNPVAGKTVFSFINEKLNGYLQTSALNNYYTKTIIDEKIADLKNRLNQVTTDWSGHSITNPKETSTKINHLVKAGYYKYVGPHATFTCKPDTISYSNALISVEKQSNHIVQHVYATSYSNSAKAYKIDGRIFVRHGYTTTDNANNTIYHWEDWYVHHIPYRERKDLIQNTHNKVGSFKIYESTAGYTFKWKQGGTNDSFELPMAKYNYINICEFKSLPIETGYVVGNLIGHLDVRITKTSFKARSTNGKGDVIIGVDLSYFVPRTN